MDDGRGVDRRLSAHSPTASLLGQLDERKTGWITVIHALYSTWKLVTSEVLQKSILRPVLFNICVNSLEEETERTLIQFVDSIKLRHTVNTLQDGAVIQSGLERPDEWENRNLMKVREDKCTWCGLTPCISMG